MAKFWGSDFEVGNFSEWDDITQGAHNAVVSDASVNGGPSVARKGSKFYQSEVLSGDLFAGGERCEIIQGSAQANNGNERWYAWSSWWPAGMPLSLGSSARSIIMGQFHSDADANVLPNMNQANIWIVNAPNVAGVNFGYTTSNPGFFFGINGGNPNLAGQRLNINGQTNGTNGEPYTSYAIDIGAASLYLGVGWVDWAVHVIWHDAGQGLAELYRRLPGESTYTRVAQLLNCSTLYKGFTSYYKIGQYRSPHPSGLAAGWAWYDEVAYGTALVDVDPGATPAPPPTDVIPPTLISAVALGSRIDLTFSEAIDTVSIPSVSAFTVKVNGATLTPLISVIQNSSLGVSIMLPRWLANTDVITVSYTVPGALPIRDLAGNNFAAVVDYAVTNFSVLRRLSGGRSFGSRFSGPTHRIVNSGGGGL